VCSSDLALVGPVQTLLKEPAPARFTARLEKELILLVTAYLQAHQSKPERRSKPAAIARRHQKSKAVAS
jgi:hypothetical protein